MATASEKLLEYSTLTGTHTAREHFLSIQTGVGSGSVKLERGVWQSIAIPVKQKVYEYFLVRLAEKYNVNPEDMVEVVNTYRGELNKWLSFVPGVTSPASEHNFWLIHDDAGHDEVSGVQVKMKPCDFLDEDPIFDWDSADGVD